MTLVNNVVIQCLLSYANDIPMAIYTIDNAVIHSLSYRYKTNVRLWEGQKREAQKHISFQ